MKEYQIIEAKDTKLDVSDFTLYRKKKFIVGYVKTIDLFPLNTPLLIRTLESDVHTAVSEDTYIMLI